MLLKDLIARGRELLSIMYPEGEAKEMVFSYMEDVFGTKRHKHIVEPDYALPAEAVTKVLTDFERMATGEPLQYVTGKACFYGRQFRVNPDVLIPRQETELLCHTLLSQSCRNQNVLDLCTGSGCIAWTLALEMPGARVTAVDISDGALSVASSQDFTEEMERTGAVEPRFVKADVLDGPAKCGSLCPKGVAPGRKFDVIVSNPPYVMEHEKDLMRVNVLDHEPHLALFVPDEDPLVFYRAVAYWAVELLAEDGMGIVEINEALAAETAEVFRKSGFSKSDIIQDLHGKDRFVRFSW